ncbi:MLP-like protein 43 [Pistacia vera]|uniref:MLP-like protein 43 n=1 Tax=Pistacia vera TaxID=55513 RepID=UPI00126329AF|nr:MLP-like protein 43 [Pistacia vera]
MAKMSKMEVKTEVNSSAEKFYNVFRHEVQLMPKIIPEKIKDVKLLQGDWGTVGSVKLWTYVPDKNAVVVKEMIEAIDDENKTIKFKILDGGIMKYYNSFESTIQVTAKEKGSLVKWAAEYEKLTDDVPDPKGQLDFALELSKDIDNHLLKA